VRIPDIAEFEERAAIVEYDGQLTRRKAEDVAAQGQGFPDAAAYWQWLAEYVLKQWLPR
jgi:hypothetical protein